MKKELKEKIELVAKWNFKVNGYSFLLSKLKEEINELLEEVEECWNHEILHELNENMISELADVENLIEQIKYIHGKKLSETTKSGIEEEQLNKMNRTIERYNIK